MSLVQVYGKHEECQEHVAYVYSQWCYFDSLDREVLREGDVLDVTWKDGTTSREMITVENSGIPMNDMGHDYDCPVSKAFVSIKCRGAVMKGRLLDVTTKAIFVSRIPLPPPEPYMEPPSRQSIYPSPRYRK